MLIDNFYPICDILTKTNRICQLGVYRFKRKIVRIYIQGIYLRQYIKDMATQRVQIFYLVAVTETKSVVVIEVRKGIMPS